MIRIFLAFPVPDTVASLFKNLEAKNELLHGIRWTSRNNLHLTLFFIGETEEFNLIPIQHNLKELFHDQSSFNIRFDTITTSGKQKNPSMIWARYHPQEEFRILGERIYETIKNFMIIKPQHEDPVPHITLARMKPGAEYSKLNLGIRKVPELPEIDFAALWKTVHVEGGVIYQELERFRFGG